MNINKNYAAIRISAEEIYMHRSLFDVRYARRIRQLIITEPTEADWAEYRKAKEAHDYLLQSPYFEDGGPDERSTVVEPEPKREYVYGETVEEWIERCQELDKETP